MRSLNRKKIPSHICKIIFHNRYFFRSRLHILAALKKLPKSKRPSHEISINANIFSCLFWVFAIVIFYNLFGSCPCLVRYCQGTVISFFTLFPNNRTSCGEYTEKRYSKTAIHYKAYFPAAKNFTDSNRQVFDFA